MKDLYEREQRVYDNALNYMQEVKDGIVCSRDEYETLADEYGKLLRQMRKFIKISDRTTVDLNASNLDLLGKVNYDALTGIYNRRYMEENLSQIIHSIAPANGLLSVLMMDIDYFKKYNDTYGHGIGDMCLKKVAEALQYSIKRPDDFVARYGGEEFIAILPNTDETGIRTMAERMLKNVKALGIPHESSSVAECVTISIGGTTGNIAYTQNGFDYVKRADEALYMSKNNGRNQYTLLEFEVAYK